jgi:hypothetical protein
MRQATPARGRLLPNTTIGVRAALIALMFCVVPTSEAYVAHPWCTSGRGWAGGFSCSFDTYQQCLENARLYTANCVANPSIDPLLRIARGSAETALISFSTVAAQVRARAA